MLASAPEGGRELPVAAVAPQRERRWLLAGMAFFLLVKLAWVLVPAGIMGVPRLGDDALVYLWTGASSVLHPRVAQRAIQDIVRLRKEQSEVTPALEHARARVTMRTTGVTASPVALAAGLLLEAGAGHKLAFALLEAGIAVFLALGIAYALTQLVGRLPAAVALVLLALAILPNQGLHYLVPSVFVLAGALFLWATVLRRPRSWPFVLLLSVLMLLAHPIGPVYLLVAAALLIGQCLLDRSVPRARLASLFALALAVPAWLAINAATGVRAPATAGLGGLSLAAVPLNVLGLAGHVKTLVLTQPVLALLLAAGLVRAALQWRERREAFLLAGTLLGVVVSTVVVNLPGYPGELPSRALIALVVVCTGIAAGWALEVAARKRHGHRWLAGALALACATQVPLFAAYGIGNLNSRHQVYDDAALRAEIAALPQDASVVWVDTDLAMMAAFLEGADAVHAVPYPMLAASSDLRAQTARASSVFVATASPERLNGASLLGSWSLRPRFLGFGFHWYHRITLQAASPDPLPQFLRVGGGDASALSVRGGDGRECRLEPSRGGWHRVTGCEGALSLRIESSARSLRLTGVALGQPDARCAWPWGESRLRLRAEPRRGGDASEFSFSFAYLLGAGPAEGIARELGPLSVHSCRSGIVWLRAGAASPTP